MSSADCTAVGPVKEVKPHFATMKAELSAFWRSFTIDKIQQKREVRRHRVPYGGYSTKTEKLQAKHILLLRGIKPANPHPWLAPSPYSNLISTSARLRPRPPLLPTFLSRRCAPLPPLWCEILYTTAFLERVGGTANRRMVMWKLPSTLVRLFIRDLSPVPLVTPPPFP